MGVAPKPLVETVVIGAKGEVVLPRKVRSELGLAPGDQLELRLENDCIVLRKKAGRFAGYLARLGRTPDTSSGR